MLAPGTVLDLGCGTGTTDFDGRVVVARPSHRDAGAEPGPGPSGWDGGVTPFRKDRLTPSSAGSCSATWYSVDDTLAEIDRVLKPGSTAVVVDLARPRNGVLRVLHRIGTALLLPLVGLLSPAPRGSIGTSTAPWIRSPPRDPLRATPSPPRHLANGRIRLRVRSQARKALR